MNTAGIDDNSISLSEPTTLAPLLFKMYFIIFVLYFLLAPVAATACNDDCIVGITNAFLARYTSTVLTTLQTMASPLQFSSCCA